MTVISLDHHELRDLYDHAMQDTLLAEIHALRFFSAMASASTNPDLRAFTLRSLDHCRKNIDKIRSVIAEVGTGNAPPQTETGLSNLRPFDFANRTFSSARVRDLAIIMSCLGLYKYTAVRYAALVDMSDKLHSSARHDGLGLVCDEIEAAEAELRRMQARI